MSELRSCVAEAMIRGYHEYQSIWEAEGTTLLQLGSEFSDEEAIFFTSLLADTIADEGTSLESAPVGSVRFVLFCFAKYLNKAISFHVQGV